MTKKIPPPLPTVLTISGSDCSAGAGLQADLKTIHALGGYALTVATAITAQNSQGVSTIHALPAHIVRAQLQTLLADYNVQAIKIGMLGSLETLETVIQCLRNLQCHSSINPPPPIVLDPVLISSSGKPLLEPSALPIFINKLLPLATLITPNIAEINALLNKDDSTLFKGEEKEMPHIAQALLALKVNAAVIKGGHSIETLATDYLIQPKLESGGTINAYSTERLQTPNTHGTGCTYASAIATELAKGAPLNEAVKRAKEYLFSALLHAENAQPSYQELSNTLKTDRGGRKGGLGHFHS